jgi:hypothetical protein
MKLSKSLSASIGVGDSMKISLPKSIAKDLKVAQEISEKKIDEIIAKIAEASERENLKLAVGDLESAVADLKAHKQTMIADMQKIRAEASIESEYEVEIIRGDNGLAKSFIMRPNRAAVH